MSKNEKETGRGASKKQEPINPYRKAQERQKKTPGGAVTPPRASESESVNFTPAAETPVQMPEQPAAPASEKVEEPVVQKTPGLAEIYETKKKEEPEPRNSRLQVVITPSLNKRLNEAVASGAIKSKNDIVNFLLERYFEESEK